MIEIYKIGGNVINDPDQLKTFLAKFASLPGNKILVHGGGKEATELGQKMGMETTMINGRRVTDKETLDLVTMIYAGLINKRIVSMLQESDCNAVGLSGADGNVIPANKRDPKPIDYGFVGDIKESDINTDFIKLLFKGGLTPVFCAICRNSAGGLLNCNADSIASALAVALSKQDSVNLTYCFEKPGVLSDINDINSVIPVISPDIFEDLVETGKISGGMLPKVTNALNAIKNGVNSVRICDSAGIAKESGTIICNGRN